MKFTNNKKAIIVFLFMLMPLPVCYITVKIKQHYARIFYSKVKNNEVFFCFDTTRNTLNYAYYIQSLRYKKGYIEFYDQKAKGVGIPLSFPIKMKSYKKPVILLDYVSLDSTLLKFVDFDTTCWGYFEFYMHRSMVSKKPPSKKMLDDQEVFLKKYKATDDYKIRSKSYKPENRISIYGIQCDCEL